MIPWTDQKLNYYLYLHYIISIEYQFSPNLAVFLMFELNQTYQRFPNSQNAKFPWLMSLRYVFNVTQRPQTNNVIGWRWHWSTQRRICGSVLNLSEGMNNISNVKVHLKTRCGNVNIGSYNHFSDIQLPRTILFFMISIWAATWDFQQCGTCGQQRLRPACAYPHSDQSLC